MAGLSVDGIDRQPSLLRADCILVYERGRIVERGTHAELLARAVDQLLLSAATHSGDAPIRIQVDGSAHRSLMLRISFDTVLPPEACFAMWVGALIFWWQGRRHPQAGGIAFPPAPAYIPAHPRHG